MSVVVESGALRGHIRRAVAGQHLSRQDAFAAINAILLPEATPAQVAALLIALATKGETAAELAGAATALRAHCTPVVARCSPLLDLCGTGGDARGTFNISTASAFVVAGAGVPVAKHGNRAMSSRCGSADVLEALGVDIAAPPDRAAQTLERCGIAFLFAQRYHPALHKVAAVRRELGVRTVFNLVGPLANPASPSHQVVGVASLQAMPLVAEALQQLGCRRGAVMHADDGLDEASLSGPTSIIEWDGDASRAYRIYPEQAGLQRARTDELSGGDAALNAALLLAVLSGEPGPQRDVVVLNAALALQVCGQAASLPAAARLAQASIDSGAAYGKLRDLIAASTA